MHSGVFQADPDRVRTLLSGSLYWACKGTSIADLEPTQCSVSIPSSLELMCTRGDDIEHFVRIELGPTGRVYGARIASGSLDRGGAKYASTRFTISHDAFITTWCALRVLMTRYDHVEPETSELSTFAPSRLSKVVSIEAKGVREFTGPLHGEGRLREGHRPKCEALIETMRSLIEALPHEGVHSMRADEWSALLRERFSVDPTFQRSTNLAGELKYHRGLLSIAQQTDDPTLVPTLLEFSKKLDWKSDDDIERFRNDVLVIAVQLRSRGRR